MAYDDETVLHLGDLPRAYSTAELAELGALECELGGAWLEFEQARMGPSIDGLLRAAERAATAAEHYAGAVIRMTIRPS